MWGSIRARLAGSKASSKRLECWTGSYSGLGGGSPVFSGPWDRIAQSRFLHEKESLDRRSGGPVNLLRPEFWEHLIAALFQRRHDRTQRGGSPAAHALNRITFFESWPNMGI
jgi:hypothetical protein